MSSQGIRRKYSTGKNISGRIGLVVTCFFLAAGVAAYREALEPVSVRSQAAMRQYVEGKHRRYRLTAFVLQVVKDNYVDPTRLKPKDMLEAALEELQKQVAEVMVIWPEEKSRVELKVDIYRRSFDLSRVDSVSTLYTALKEILTFVEKYAGKDQKAEEIEYAAINGMLHTLDPHSLLMDPEVYKNLKMGTRGSFGGLGIVISIREGLLQVVSPIDDSPAYKAGLKAGDVIVKIEGETTINMTLNEAVNKLRGDPGTKVEIWIKRKGWAEARKFIITRAVIHIKSVESMMLKNGIGFLRIKQFSRKTDQEVAEHLKKMKKKGAKGIVLGLYNNPGGLLGQAIRVADLFIDKGSIVTTVGYAGKKRETMKATKENTVWRKPVIVLVNSGSASASEILAGALKERGRAIVLGETTFGKGSVQVLFDNDDGSALKITTRQYLTPGDNSIQSVGIVPDVRFVPVAIRKDNLKLFATSKKRREHDLEKHLNPSWEKSNRPSAMAEIKYLANEEKARREFNGSISGNAADIEVIKIAAGLLSQNPTTRRKELLQNAKTRISEIREVQQKRIAQALKKLGVDWSVEPVSTVPMLEATLLAEPRDFKVKAGESVKLTVKVTNLGLGTAYRVRAISSSCSHLFDEKEFVFGKIAPGETRQWTIKVHIPFRYHNQAIPLSIRFFEEYGNGPPLLKRSIKIRGHKRPVFAAQYQLIDDLLGNRDGLIQKGERVRLRVTVRNVGKGTSHSTEVSLKNLSGSAVSVRQGKVELGKIEVGEEKDADLVFDVKKGLTFRTLMLKLVLQDTALKKSFEERVVFSISGNGRLVEKLDGWIQVKKKEAELRGGPDKDSALLGWATRGSTFLLSGRIHGWYRVEWKPGRPAFLPIESSEVVLQKKQLQKDPIVRRVFHLTPPIIKTKKVPLITKKPFVFLRGVVFDDKKVKDVYIEVIHVGEDVHRKKVFYRSNRFSKEEKQIPFELNVELRKGLNYINIVGRENERVKTEKMLIVLKRGERWQKHK